MSSVNNYRGIVKTSEKVSWTVDEILAGKVFDASKPFAPDSWLGINSIDFLSDQQRLILNHARAFSYIHLLGHYEDFIVRHITGVAVSADLSNSSRNRAIYRFCDEEIKHQELFAQAEIQMEESCGFSFGRYFDDNKINLNILVDNIMNHSPPARALILQAFEWGTQRHYLESVKDTQGIDALYSDLLKAHWLEESQHVKIGKEEIMAFASALNADERCAVFDEIISIAGLIGETFGAQVQEELKTLEQQSKLSLNDQQRSQLFEALMTSMQAIWTGVALSHPEFCALAKEFSAEGAAKLGIV